MGMDRDQMIEIAKAEKATAFFDGKPPVYLIGGEPVTKEHFVATSGLDHLLPEALERPLRAKSGAANTFLDVLKGAGIVITGEDTLREDLAQAADWKGRFALWVEQGRDRGVTFHVSAAGRNDTALYDIFSRYGIGIRHFLMHLRPEPVGEVQRAFSARAES